VFITSLLIQPRVTFIEVDAQIICSRAQIPTHPAPASVHDAFEIPSHTSAGGRQAAKTRPGHDLVR